MEIGWRWREGIESSEEESSTVVLTCLPGTGEKQVEIV